MTYVSREAGDPVVVGVSEPDVSRLTDRVWVGAGLSEDPHESVAQAQALVDRGITHVVDCRIERDDRFIWAHHASVTYRNPGIEDAGQTIPDEWFEEQVEYLQVALLASSATVLIHCSAGANRGPSLTLALLLAEGWEANAAVALIRRARPGASIRYADQVMAWHQRRTEVDSTGR